MKERDGGGVISEDFYKIGSEFPAGERRDFREEGKDGLTSFVCSSQLPLLTGKMPDGIFVDQGKHSYRIALLKRVEKVPRQRYVGMFNHIASFSSPFE